MTGDVYYLILFLLGLYFAARSLAFGLLRMQLYGLRSYSSIPRFVHHQRACDVLIILYHSVTLALSCWMITCGVKGLMFELTDKYPTSDLLLICPIVLGMFYLAFIGITLVFNGGFGLKDLLKDIEEQWEHESVITDDHDHEVDMFRALKNVKKLLISTIVWICVLALLFIINYLKLKNMGI